jgi:hypothetical protein
LAAGKNGKAAGPRQCSFRNVEMWRKYGGNELGYISSIHKKGDRRSCSNYRGICVINPIMKKFGRLIKRRLEEEYISLEEQCCFTT